MVRPAAKQPSACRTRRDSAGRRAACAKAAAPTKLRTARKAMVKSRMPDVLVGAVSSQTAKPAVATRAHCHQSGARRNWVAAEETESGRRIKGA